VFYFINTLLLFIYLKILLLISACEEADKSIISPSSFNAKNESKKKKLPVNYLKMHLSK
jgi:hypothetical protein